MKVIRGNIFTSTCQTLVNTVNCFGVMGTGLALECKYRYPDMYLRYKKICDNKHFSIGKLYLYKTSDRWILNFPTKYHWKYESKKEYIEKGLEKFLDSYRRKGIQSIAFPLLGTQNGGLLKEESLAILEKYLRDIDIPFEIYEYDPSVQDDIFHRFRDSVVNLNERALTKLTDLSESKIRKLKDVLESDSINNMSSLMTLEGIGESTVEKCFRFALRGNSGEIQLDLF